MLLLVLVMYQTIKPQPRPKLHAGWMILASSASGVLAGLVGMGGPAIVFWAMAHDWDTARSRCLLWTVFLFMVPWQLAVDCWLFGWEILESAALGIVYTPVVVLATLLGARLGDRLRPHAFGDRNLPVAGWQYRTGAMQRTREPTRGCHLSTTIIVPIPSRRCRASDRQACEPVAGKTRVGHRRGEPARGRQLDGRTGLRGFQRSCSLGQGHSGRPY